MKKSPIDVNACLQYVNKLFSTDKKLKKVYKLLITYSECIKFRSKIFDIFFYCGDEPEISFSFIIYFNGEEIYSNEELKDNTPNGNCFEQDFEIFVHESLDTLEKFTLAYKQIKKHHEVIDNIVKQDEELAYLCHLMTQK